MSYITDDHSTRLPTIRIQKVVLRNFKSVAYGEISMACSKEIIPYNTQSDILGIYGQNGSGKTAFIEALAILQIAMSGGSIHPIYADCIAIGSDHAELEFTFDLQYHTNPISRRTMTYSFFIRQEATGTLDSRIKEAASYYGSAIEDELDSDVFKRRVCVYNEVITISGEIHGENKKKQIILDTSCTDGAFGPISKRKLFCTPTKAVMQSLAERKQRAYTSGMSFLFCDDTLDKFTERNERSTYLESVLELREFALEKLAVVDTKMMGITQIHYAIPIFIESSFGPMVFKEMKSEIYPDEVFNNINLFLMEISDVLMQIIPGMRLSLKDLGPALLESGENGRYGALTILRDGIELPIRCISDGARKIIIILGLLIQAYNDPDVTVAIDELDAGIFEYLLGLLLKIHEESGKGQLFFTSHNLRPLEVLENRDFIYFTTTNPNNRYIRLKNIRKSNNLRDTYFREILLGEQDEEIYKTTKKERIVAALRKVGM